MDTSENRIPNEFSFPVRIGLDYNSPMPFYAQVKEDLIRRIEHGECQAGEQMPAEQEMCKVYGVSRTVIRQALRELEYQGMIIRRKGKGTFVARPKITESIVGKLTGFYQDMSERGYQPISQVLKHAVVKGTSKITDILNINDGEKVIEIERLRFIGEEPLVLVTTYIPYHLCAGIESMDLTRVSLYEVLQDKYGLEIVRGRRVMEAVASTQREALLLQIEEGAPLMLIDSVSYLQDGTPVEYYHALHRGDHSRFEVELLRGRDSGQTSISSVFDGFIQIGYGTKS